VSEFDAHCRNVDGWPQQCHRVEHKQLIDQGKAMGKHEQGKSDLELGVGKRGEIVSFGKAGKKISDNVLHASMWLASMPMSKNMRRWAKMRAKEQP
jgi:hypothetical protein